VISVAWVNTFKPQKALSTVLTTLLKTTFYGRDRGIEDTEFKVDETFEAFLERADGCGAEFYYIMKDGVWYVGTTYGSDTVLGYKLVPLAEALADQDITNNETVSAE
jgi:hypothetical protein